MDALQKAVFDRFLAAVEEATRHGLVQAFCGEHEGAPMSDEEYAVSEQTENGLCLPCLRVWPPQVEVRIVHPERN